MFHSSDSKSLDSSPTGSRENKFFITIPHSGEKVPDLCTWLKGLEEPILMCDIDRYVDQLYKDIIEKIKIPFVTTDWHRYAVDLNRLPEDIDAGTVQGCLVPFGKNSRGFHWGITTTEVTLMKDPMPLELHLKLIDLIYKPFHSEIENNLKSFKEQGFKNIYHLDLHSMPSIGTSQHRDPGELRADIVISDSKGVSSSRQFVDLVISEYVRAGFKVGYNWPYFGGRLTEQYGRPHLGHHTVQVELNRSLYMNETTKHKDLKKFEITQQKLAKAITEISNKVSKL